MKNNQQHCTAETKRKHQKQGPATCNTKQSPSLRNLCRGLRRAADPARSRAGGVEASSSGKHAGQVATLHHKELAAHVGKGCLTLVPGVGKGGVGGFAEELHRTGAKAPQRLKGDAAYPGHAWSA
jgi:hypothetical protein